MNTPQNTDFKREKHQKSGYNFVILAISSLIALIATFSISATELELAHRALIFGCILFLYLTICAAIYVFREKHVENLTENVTEENSVLLKPDVESRLFALEEANQFFGASLKPNDMFRLVSSRINELISFAACVVFVADENNERLTIEFADGKNAWILRKTEINSIEGNAGKTFFSREPQFDQQLLLEKTAINPIDLQDFNSAIAVPLFRDGEVFGVLQLYGDAENSFNADSLLLLDAIGTRVAPLLLSSFAFERSMSNALTDSLTELPNERAFYLVLENQIAESQRYGNQRPLNILAIDLKDFNAVNQTHGHATGDRLLKFAGKIIKAQLRQMDFIARSGSDEFLVVLPTATEKIALEIIERIERAFVTKPFIVSPENKIFLQFNFGAATFGEDGETPQQLIKSANIRKYQTKTNLPNKVLWFPKEFIN